MSGLTAFLQTELLFLSSEARRKHPEIKEAAERLSAILRSFKERPGYSIANELSKSEDALRPFVLACETKQVKLVTIAIGCIQKLISFHAIPETSVRVILRTLTDISVHGVEIQLKILQTVLPLLTNYRSVHDDILAEALLICFRLQDSKIAVVNNTAAATLRQLVIFVFDKVGKEDLLGLREEDANHEIQLGAGDTIKLHPCAKDAFYLFRDLCLLTSGDPPEYLRLHHLSKTFGLELVESVLANHYALFKEHKELSSLLRESVCPLIIKTFSEKHEFPQTMRLSRVVDILIRQFNEILMTECEIFLSMFVKVLEPENPLWQRVLAMEIFRGVCSDSALLCSIYKWYDRQAGSTDAFRDMITGFGRLATEKPQLIGATQGGRESIEYGSGAASHIHHMTHPNPPTSDNSGPGLSASGSSMRIQCIDQLDKADPPVIPETYIFYLALLCLNSIADGLAGFVLPMFSPGKSLSASTKATSDEESRSKSGSKADTTDNSKMSLVTDMTNVAWPGLLAAMSFYISSNLDEELFQNTMRSYQNFTNVCGMLDLVVPRDAFLTNLCKNAIPPSPVLSSGFFSGKNTGSSTSIATITTNSLAVSYSDLSVQQQQVLANISLSDKNLYSLRVLLNIAMFLGGVLGPSWYLVLETLQQADLLLINRPIPKGTNNPPGSASTSHTVRRTLSGTPSNGMSSVSGHQNTATGQSMNNQYMDADHTAIIQTSLKRLFDNSKYLDNDAFVAFTTALCRLSAEASGVHFSGGEEISTSKSSRIKLFNKTSFAIDQLCYISTLNMSRLISSEGDPVAWDLIITHLIDTANFASTPASIRTQCCEVISTIIITAMNQIIAEQKEADNQAQPRLLAALSQCINYSEEKSKSSEVNNEKGSSGVKAFGEVQKMALETLNKILETSGHSFTCGWGIVFDMLRHVTVTSTAHPDYTDEDDEDKSGDEDSKHERASIDTTTSSLVTANAGHASTNNKASGGLIKVAFTSLQLICTDFLSLLSPDCLRQCIATLGSFGMQCEDLNISLTAVGLLWNLSDFIQTKRLDSIKDLESDTSDEAIEKESMNIDLPITDEESPQVFSILWMLLLLQLSHNCTDWRPEVRNGANQTLFRTIMMNGNLLGPHMWNACVWQVLFPLLDAIKMSAIRATRMMQSGKTSLTTSSPDRDTSGFMLHHSRDTADKQWDETKVLVLTGISKIFRDFFEKLQALDNFKQAWSLLLAHLEDSCLRSSQEVSLASIKSFKNIVTLPPDDKNFDKSIVSLWRSAWRSWEIIGNGIMMVPSTAEEDNEETQENSYRSTLDSELLPLTLSLSSSSAAQISDDFTQDTLTAYIRMFVDLYRVIAPGFSLEDIGSLLGVLRNMLVYSTSPQYRPDIDNLSPLQEGVLEVIQTLDMTVPGVPPLVLMDISEYMTLAFLSPPDDAQKTKGGYIPPSQRKFSTVTYIALNKKCSTMVAHLFKAHVNNKALYTEGVFERIIGAFGLPMKLKYDCPPSHKHGDDKTPLWKSATLGLLDVLEVGLEKLRDIKEVPIERFVGVWRALVDIFEGSLLSPSTPPSSMTIEELDVDEHFDISVLSVIQNDVVVYMGEPRVPIEVIQKLVNVIRESSRLYYVDANENHHRREEADQESPRELKEAYGRKSANYRSSDIIGTTGTIVPVMKESFAYAALRTLFSLCSSEKQDHLEVRKRIAQVTIPVLLERCETILRNYTADAPLLGRCPFPRVRKEEIIFLLQQSIHLKLQKNIIKDESEEKGTIRHLVLSGPRAHLFYLYPSLCNMISCDDAVVVELIRECLQTAGTEMGLMLH
ncbi:hypothetical protein F4703DRAFT_1831802 [Phycomyces blakesleeanus]